MQPAPRNLWIPLLIAGVIGGGLLGSMFFPPYMVWAGITMAMFGTILLGHPRHLLFFLWLWVAFQPLIVQISNNPAVSYAEELMMATIIAICVANHVWRRTNGYGFSGIFKILTALLGIAIASAIVNHSPTLNAANFFITYLSFPFIFYVAYTTLNRRHWRYLFGAVIGLMLLQFALNVGWRLGVNPLPNEFSRFLSPVDMAQGTFGSCAMVAYFMVAVIFLLFSALRLDKKYTPWIILLLLVAALQSYMTYTNHSYIYFVALLPIYLVISKQSARVRVACAGLVVFGALGFSFLAAWDASSGFTASSVDVNLDRQNLEYRFDSFIHGPKIELINRIAFQNATRDPFLWLLGNGPGNGLSAIGMARGSSFAWEYLGEFVQSAEAFKSRGMTSISGSFYSGILSIWSELGAVGYLLYVGLYIYIILHVVRRLFRNQYTDPFQRVLAEGFVMAVLTFLLSNLLQDLFWAKYFAVGLWIWAAMVWDPVAGGQRSEDGGQRSEDGSQSVRS